MPWGSQQRATLTATDLLQQTAHKHSACVPSAAPHRLHAKDRSGAARLGAFLEVPALGVLQQLATTL